jgi:hypothetical protein
MNKSKEMLDQEEINRNMAYNLEHGIEASPKKPRGSNLTPKKKKRKK